MAQIERSTASETAHIILDSLVSLRSIKTGIMLYGAVRWQRVTDIFQQLFACDALSFSEKVSMHISESSRPSNACGIKIDASIQLPSCSLFWLALGAETPQESHR